ncbi:hypothetical protein MHYP_G00193680 [Metynnis hypsauchen]
MFVEYPEDKQGKEYEDPWNWPGIGKTRRMYLNRVLGDRHCSGMLGGQHWRHSGNQELERPEEQPSPENC